MELFSAVQERLQERISPLRAWLFPRRVFLQLEDQSITAMALEGRRIIWLERVPLPAGLCENGEAIRTDSIADLLGDLFVERGFSGARVDAVLPPAASQMRLVQWPDAAWPNDPERTLSENEQQLALKTALQYLDLHLVDLDRDPPASLLVTVPSSTLDRWIEVFDLAGVPLDRMESASLCLCRGLQPLLQEQPVGALSVVLQLEPQRSELLVLENVDQPGMVGTIGSILGRANVNIADLSLSRLTPGGTAYMVVRVDTEPGEASRREIKGHAAIRMAKFVQL